MRLGFGSLVGAALWLVAAVGMLSVRATDGLRLAIVLLAHAIALFFIDFFGGGMEFERHVCPAILAYVEGAVFMAVAAVAWVSGVARGRYRSRAGSAQGT